MKTRLSNEEIVRLASLVAGDIGMRGLDEQALMSSLEKSPVMPTIISDGNSQLWVDRYYVAHSSLDEEFVHYVYIAPEHAEEELKDIRIGKESAMLEDITRQLRNALRTGRPFYLTLAYRRRMEQGSGLAI